VKINESEATVFLDADGVSVMQAAGVDVQNPVYVEDTDDMGIWARVDRPDGKHIVLIRWDYVLSLDVERKSKNVGLKP
jgi:hypothetical protein